MALAMGDYNKLKVIREADFSYILSDGDIEVFLHKKQTTRDLVLDEEVNVFLYFDNQKRITATMKKPFVDKNTSAFLKVVDVNHRLGVFLDNGLIKDLLLSRDDLPFIKKEWPAVGDILFVRLRASKSQLTAKIIPRYSIRDYLIPNTELIEKESYCAFNIYKAEEGNVFITKEGHNIFVYFKHLRKTYRLGEEAYVKVINTKLDYKYNGTLIEQKELMISKDAQSVKEYLEKHDGVMNLTDRSTPEEINEVFQMSKSAFKRALGTLYKEKIVLLNAEDTRLLNPIE
ncbi:MAG: DNA-binding protein [Candidatus Izimaplasma sp.]|nr:DNA-binding protein [Candidatus Izimaplasma bacterium]